MCQELFLDYVAGKKSDNDFVKRLDEEVRQARKNREWRHEYMTLRIRDMGNLEEESQRVRAGRSVMDA